MPRCDVTTPSDPPSRTAPSGDQNVRWIALAVVVLFAVLAWPALRSEIYIFDDLGAFHYPLRGFYASCLKQGQAFDWCPDLFCGYYFTGEGQAGSYHPLHWILYRWLPLDAAFNFELLVSYPLLLAGMICLARQQGLRRDAAWLSAALFTFSSFMLLHFVHVNAVAVLAHLPWLLWAEGLTLQARGAGTRRRACVLIALLTGSQLLLGYPQYVWISLLAELWYVVVMARRESTTRGQLLSIAVAKLCGLLLGAVQLLPTADALSHSTRHDSTLEFAVSGSLHPGNLVQLVAPYLFASRVMGDNTHELAIYPGAVTLLLVVWLVANLPREWHVRRTVFALLALGLVSLDLSLGAFGTFYKVQVALPIVGSFRFPCRFSVILQLSLVLLAAIGFQQLLKDRQTNPRRLVTWWPVWALVATSLLVTLIGSYRASDAQLATVFLRAIAPLTFLIAAALIAVVHRYPQAAPLLIVLALVDVGAYGLTYSAVRETGKSGSLFARLENPPGKPTQGALAADLHQPGDAISRTANRRIMFGWRQVDGYLGLQPAKQLNYLDPAALRAAGVRWVALNPTTIDLAGLQPIDAYWSQVTDPLPLANSVSSIAISDDAAEGLLAIDTARATLVDRATAESIARQLGIAINEEAHPLSGDAQLTPLSPTSEMTNQVTTLVYHAPGHIQVAAMGTHPTLVSLAESYHPGWEVRVDGHLAPTYRVNGDFLGTVVAAGNYLVEWRFRPASLRHGAMLTLLGCLLVTGYAVYAGIATHKNSDHADLALEL